MINWILTLAFVSLAPLSSSVGIYQQCGGDGYKGSTNCNWPLGCFRRSRWFSSCQASCPAADWDCAKTGGYSSGTGLARAWEQCGGNGWKGPQGCSEYPCQWRSQWYAQCRPECPAGWLCQGGGSSSTQQPVYSTVGSTEAGTTRPSDPGTDNFSTIPPTVLLESSSEDESSSTDSSIGVTSPSLVDNSSDAILGRYVVAQMLGSSIYELDMHPLESPETTDLYDMVVDHVITIAEMQEPGSMAQFGAALQSESFYERLEAWEIMHERVQMISESSELVTAVMLDPLFAGQLQPTTSSEDPDFDTRTLRTSKGPCKEPIPDIGQVNGLYGDGRSGITGTLVDALKVAVQDYEVNAAVLTAVELGIGPEPDSESRLGAFYATRGRKHGTVGSSVHRAIGAIYLIFGTAGEERIGRVFNDEAAIALYDDPIKSLSSKCMAAVEHLYWANVKNENSRSFGGVLGEFVTPRARDCIQRLLSGNPCSSAKFRSLMVNGMMPAGEQEQRQYRQRRQNTGQVPSGYTRTNYRCMKKVVYCNSKASSSLACIVEDRTSHKGGVWKAGPEKAWAQKDCPTNLRSGTYDANLNWIAP